MMELRLRLAVCLRVLVCLCVLSDLSHAIVNLLASNDKMPQIITRKHTSQQCRRSSIIVLSYFGYVKWKSYVDFVHRHYVWKSFMEVS